MGSRLEKNSESVKKRIENHTFDNEEGEEYEGSKFGGFNEYFRRKKLKLQNLDSEVRSQSRDNPPIFRGVVAHVNGYTQPSLNDLHRLIVSHGGGFMQYLDGKTTVTHIIAANLTPKKAIEFRRYRMVKPAWVVDSIKAGRLLPWDTYRVLDQGVGQRLLGFDEGKVVSQPNTNQRGYREQTNASWYTSQVRNVAEDIDDEDGARFPSSQAVALNGSSTYFRSQAAQPPAAPSISQGEDTSDTRQPPTSSENFEVTSSLEDLLNKVDQTAPKQAPRLASPVADNDISSRQESPCPVQVEESVENADVEAPYARSPSRLNNNLKRVMETDEAPLSKKAKILTAEEHNAILLADPHIRKSSTANPDFIKQYYSESRLHHLSAWKAELKSKFQQMAAEISASQKPAKRKPGSRRYIMHVDFDSFFCAVSLKAAPEYVDKPAVVAHGNGTGSEIASCNYPARAYGIKNGMWMKHALKLYSDIKVLPYDFPAYEEASQGFYKAIIEVGGVVQSVSVDEALVDITALCLPAGGTDGFGVQEGSIWREQEKADEIAQKLRMQIKSKTGCEVSVGIGNNILLAKVALRKAKPAGQHQIKPGEVLDFLGELSVQDLPGVAHSIGGRLEEIGVKFVKDVRQLTKERLMTVLGPKTGEKIWDYSRGIDKQEVGEQTIRKSVSAEVNWGIRFLSQAEAEEFIQNLCIELQRRLVEQRVKGRQLTMKIMRKSADAPLDPPKHLGHGKCDTFNKSIVLGVATNSAEVTGREAISILRSYGFSPGELRGLGVQMTKLEPLKGGPEADGSQRRIDFGKPTAPRTFVIEDPIDDPQTPTKPRPTPVRGLERHRELVGESTNSHQASPFVQRLLQDNDPIDDINSPKKAKSTPVHPAAAITRANAVDKSATRLLNLTGTQFILPSQVDTAVLNELPHDIRSKLMAQSKLKPRERSPTPQSRSMSPAVHPDDLALPSQVDPEVFKALPADMKAEILKSYSVQPAANPTPPLQTLLPQSPRKTKPLPQKKWTPTKKRGRPPGSRNKKEDPYAPFRQSNFVPLKGGDPFVSEDDTTENDTLDPDFLSALPEELRAEIIAENRRKRLAQKGGLIASKPRKKPLPTTQIGQRRLRLPARDPKPTFTTQKLSTLEELRDTLSAWFEEFRDDGPHPDDVAAMERYLRRVVVEEKDMAKVVGVCRWLSWLVSSNKDAGGRVEIWESAVSGIMEKVQLAVQERGLGRLHI